VTAAETSAIDNLDTLDRYSRDRVELDRELTGRISRASAVMTAPLAELLDAVVAAEDAESFWASGVTVGGGVVGGASPGPREDRSVVGADGETAARLPGVPEGDGGW